MEQNDKKTGTGPVHPDIEGEGMDRLRHLALDLRWSWNNAADEFWRELDPELWDLTQNPWFILQTVSRDHFNEVLSRPEFRDKLEALNNSCCSENENSTWFSEHHADSPLRTVAYFCMEFMLSEALPIYSGGLGNVAGDLLKTASDLGVPVVGVGLLYQQGYFRQVIDNNGWQQALFPYNDPGQLPITPVRHENGEWLRIQTHFPGYTLFLRVWQVQVGRVKLYLLDSNDPANFPAHRGITSELYGGGAEMRLMQEITLGIGGWRLLRALGIEPEVCHLNEGHAAFAILERARWFMEDNGVDFATALTATRAGNLFTTHTPVAAGFDRFAPSLLYQYLGRYTSKRLGIEFNDLLALGRLNPQDTNEPFNMAYLAVRGSGAVNGVSALHGKVSRRLFDPLFPRWPEEEVPVGHVTNGVHFPSWESKEAEEMWSYSCGGDRWLGTTEELEAMMECVSNERFWELRASTTRALVDYVRVRFSRQLEVSGVTPSRVEEARRIFDPNALTIAFARRFAPYKRPTLLLHDPERLLRILTDPHRPVQLIIAGKAHPADQEGQEMIRQWVEFVRRPEASRHVVFLSDYDMVLTERLVQGVDVWLNTPRRPWEASGTSGMKALVNGGINLSELDGWWIEAFTPDVGWALGDGEEHGADPAWDAAEAERLYQILETEVVPEFYTRDASGIPRAWVDRMRSSMSRLTPRFSANRMLREYTEKYYLPAADNFRQRAAEKGARAAEIVRWRDTIAGSWRNLRFGQGSVVTEADTHRFEVHLYLNGVDPDSVRVELYADADDGGEPIRREMTRGQLLFGAENGYVYFGEVSASRPIFHYRARVVPYREGLAVPLEAPQILWQE
ncbi:alpha-glucan family phosphorylase [Geomesophilobacter sediminis]|uniref:Alpha-glucan family phosphorylase n=1 Tax=Geomesophilobacter sediminis TaxID=2798584 RepID=A0A8J7M084_9BACT|nr:alpha-glucan family phosphorylase [Geomesophilobacter sediminis]MBJ6723852.1 alpha-glucan family phosphorylase [Geomesophilobacter sediminis]